MKKAKPQYSNNFSYLLKLLACVLNDTETPKPNADTDWASVFYMAKCHSVAGMLFHALKRLEGDNLPDTETLEKFRNEYTIDLLKDTNTEEEAQKILSLFSSQGIKAVPVKGFYIKKDYPHASMRTMTDTDILCRKEDIPKVIRIFEERGYTLRIFENSDVDATKEPFHHFEIHTVLISNKHTYGGYFDDFIDRANSCDENSIYKLSTDDSYIYLLSHLAKHFESGGAGVRMIMDVYVFIRAHKSELCEDYLQRELEKIRLTEFRKIVENMAENWFSGNDEPKTDTLVSDYILCCGTFGTSANSFLVSALSYEKTTGKKHTGTKRVIRNIFLPCKSLSIQYPLLSKHKLLYPYYWLCYWCRRVFIKRDINKNNLKNYYLRTDSSEGQKVKQMLTDMGLDVRDEI